MEKSTEAIIRLPPSPRSAEHARRFVERTLSEWGLRHLADVADLLTSELVANAVRHAGTTIRVRLRRSNGQVLVEVGDQSDGQPRPRLPEPDRESGRGLFLVDQFAADWGVRPAPDGKVVWFCLPEREPAMAW